MTVPSPVSKPSYLPKSMLPLLLPYFVYCIDSIFAWDAFNLSHSILWGGLLVIHYFIYTVSSPLGLLIAPDSLSLCFLHQPLIVLFPRWETTIGFQELGVFVYEKSSSGIDMLRGGFPLCKLHHGFRDGQKTSSKSFPIFAIVSFIYQWVDQDV